MSFNTLQRDPRSHVSHVVAVREKEMSVLGPLDPWEIEEIENRTGEMGFICYNIAEMKQTSIPRTLKWLKMSAEEGYEEGVFAYAALLHGMNADLQYKGDEAAWWLTRVRNGLLVDRAYSFSSDGLRARRHVVRTLLSGSLSKNQDSVLYRSFFGSGLREVHLFPLISRYLVEEKGAEERRELTLGSKQYLRSLVDMSIIIFCDPVPATSLTLSLKHDNQFLLFLPLLFSLFPNINELILRRWANAMKVDFSLLQLVDTSKLETLVCSCFYETLAPLSLCDLSSLRSLNISNFPNAERLHALSGISSDITRSLTKLSVQRCNLKDICPLSGCDLSSLEALYLYGNRSLTSLSPLRGSDLSSLTFLQLGSTNISDLSPLCECKGLAVEELYLSKTPIEDLSSLSLLDLSRLKKPISLKNTNVSELSTSEYFL